MFVHMLNIRKGYDSNLPKREVVEFHRSPYATPASYNKVKKGYPSVYQSPGRKKIGENILAVEKNLLMTKHK